MRLAAVSALVGALLYVGLGWLLAYMRMWPASTMALWRRLPVIVLVMVPLVWLARSLEEQSILVELCKAVRMVSVLAWVSGLFCIMAQFLLQQGYRSVRWSLLLDPAWLRSVVEALLRHPFFGRFVTLSIAAYVAGFLLTAGYDRQLIDTSGI